jgi:predicted dehydrogenase
VSIITTAFGGTIKSVSAINQNNPEQRVFAGTDWSQYDEDIQYIPSTGVNVMVEFENGGTGVVNSSIHYPLNSYIMSVEAVFEQGVVNFSGMNMFSIKGKLTWFSKKSITAVDMNYMKNMYVNGYELSFYNSVEDFVRCYVKGKNVETDGKMGLLNMELETIISNSDKQNCKIINEN